MKNFLIYSSALLVTVALTSLACSSKFSGFDKTKTGLYYKLYKVSSDTGTAKTGDFISLDMKYTTEKDSVLFDNRSGMGQQIRFQLPPSDFSGDIYEGIKMLSPGDSGVFLVSADSLFTRTFRMPRRPAFIDSSSYIKFYITLLSADSKEELLVKEKQMLASYLSANQITAAPRPSGLYYIEITPGTGNKLDTGSIIKMHFTLSTAAGDSVFSTYKKNEPLQIPFGKPFDNPGFDEGISYMKKGGKSRFIVPSEIGFGAQARGPIGPYTTLVYDVEIVDVMSKAELEKFQAAEKQKQDAAAANVKQMELVKLNKYLKDNNITVKPRPSGLYYIEKVKGTGTRAIPGKKVSVHYTGTLLDGTKFDSSIDRGTPFSFVLGQNQVIKGWDEGIALMNTGGKAILIIPSSLGYGDRKLDVIPPYSTLVFDVELMGVE